MNTSEGCQRSKHHEPSHRQAPSPEVIRAFSEGEQRYRAVIEQIAEGIYLIDAETGRILESNAALERMLGYTAGELCGMKIHDLIAHDRDSIDANFRRTVSEGRHFRGERCYRRRDGTLVDVEAGASVISYEDKKAVCVVLRDVSVRKEAERATAEIREAERRRIARDLHDTVLQDLAAALQTLQADRVEGAARQEPGSTYAIDALRRAIRSLREAVHDLRPEKRVPFVRLVESLVELNRQMSPQCEVSLKVEEGFPYDLPQTAKVEVVRVVQEALANARRHSGARGIETVLALDGEGLRVEVADDGGGFAPEEAAEGVGLSAMRERALAIGSEYELFTGVGEGTRVVLRIPTAEI